MTATFLALGGPLHTQVIDYEGDEAFLSVPAGSTDMLVQTFTYRRAEMKRRGKLWKFLIPADVAETETKEYIIEQMMNALTRRHEAGDRVLFGVGIGQSTKHPHELIMTGDISWFGVYRNGMLVPSPIRKDNLNYSIDKEALRTLRDPGEMLKASAHRLMVSLLDKSIIEPMLDQAGERHKWTPKKT